MLRLLYHNKYLNSQLEMTDYMYIWLKLYNLHHLDRQLQHASLFLNFLHTKCKLDN